MRRTMWRLVAVAGLAFTGMTMPASAAEQVEVDIQNFTFQPTPVLITVGDSVRWTNRDGATHTATAPNFSFNSGFLETNQSSTPVPFNATGTFEYICTIHPDMLGRVVVASAPVIDEAPMPWLLSIGAAGAVAVALVVVRRRRLAA